MKKVTGKNYTLYNADCRDVLKKMIEREETVHNLVTDAPYSLESIQKRFGSIDMSKDTFTNKRITQRGDGFARLVNTRGSSGGWLNQTWDTTKIERDPEFWKLCHEVILPGGFLLVFAHTTTYHETAMAIKEAGFKMRGMFTWVHGQNFNKGKSLSKAIDRQLLGTEKFSKLKKKHTDSYGNYTPITEEAKRYTGWCDQLKNSFEPIVFAQKPLSEKNIASNVIKHKTGALNIGDTSLTSGGKTRQFSNFITDGSPEVLKRFEELGRLDASEFFFIAKPSKSERTEGLTVGERNPHPTTKPISLLSKLITLVAVPGTTVLDTFMGSGTTGCSALSLGYKFIGVEREEQYFNVARQRLKHYASKVKPDTRVLQSVPKEGLKLKPIDSTTKFRSLF